MAFNAHLVIAARSQCSQHRKKESSPRDLLQKAQRPSEQKKEQKETRSSGRDRDAKKKEPKTPQKRSSGGDRDAKGGSEGVQLGEITVGKGLKHPHMVALAEGTPLAPDRDEFEQILAHHVKEGSVFRRIDVYGNWKEPRLIIHPAESARTVADVRESVHSLAGGLKLDAGVNTSFTNWCIKGIFEPTETRAAEEQPTETFPLGGAQSESGPTMV